MIKVEFIIVLTLSISLSGSLKAQEFKKLAELPQFINETSGIVANGPNTFWTFNDSGGEAELYLFNTVGNHLRTLKITNAWNRDWEDICKDRDGNLYIANTGNNYNNNTDLTIFKIPDPKTILADSVKAEIISYSYEDQYSFPPPMDSMNFDCEAIIWKDNNLYLFTKHRTIPVATNIYRIPATGGHHVAKKINSITTSSKEISRDEIRDHWITSADISPNGKIVCLLSHNKMWMLQEFEDDNFSGGKVILIHIGESSQKEAVCFTKENELLITDENEMLSSSGGNLYKLRISTAEELRIK